MQLRDFLAHPRPADSFPRTLEGEPERAAEQSREGQKKADSACADPNGMIDCQTNDGAPDGKRRVFAQQLRLCFLKHLKFARIFGPGHRVIKQLHLCPQWLSQQLLHPYSSALLWIFRRGLRRRR